MIIFFNKDTGKITGTVIGRTHTEDQLKVIVGNPDNTEKIIVNWIPFRWYGEDGTELKEGDSKVFTADYRPNNDQSELFIELDKDPNKIYEYKVNLPTLKLVHK